MPNMILLMSRTKHKFQLDNIIIHMYVYIENYYILCTDKLFINIISSYYTI